jgi:hypothetical protein
VLLHFVHYSTVTSISQMTKSETQQHGIGWPNNRYKERHQRDVDEVQEGMMLHSKKVTDGEVGGRKWDMTCRARDCKIGIAWPLYVDEANKTAVETINEKGMKRNCFINLDIEAWVPLLDDALKRRTAGAISK